jgi:hypothetical protein
MYLEKKIIFLKGVQNVNPKGLKEYNLVAFSPSMPAVNMVMVTSSHYFPLPQNQNSVTDITDKIQSYLLSILVKVSCGFPRGVRNLYMTHS